jgi:hypothetical protein
MPPPEGGHPNDLSDSWSSWFAFSIGTFIQQSKDLPPPKQLWVTRLIVANRRMECRLQKRAIPFRDTDAVADRTGAVEDHLIKSNLPPK